MPLWDAAPYSTLNRVGESIEFSVGRNRGGEPLSKEAWVSLFATRTSCQYFQGNQLRMMLAALGYVLIERLRAR
jgi:hypothetical protein